MLKKCKVELEAEQLYQMVIPLYRPLSLSVSDNVIFLNGLNITSDIAEMHEEFNSERDGWTKKFGRRVAGLLSKVYTLNNSTITWQNQISYAVLSGAL